MSNFWIAEWLDENEIKHEWEITHRLETEDGVQSLVERATESYEYLRNGGTIRPSESQLVDSIVAGRRLDLSGRISCFAYNCLREAVDRTFKNVWHYFDHIIVEGVSPITWLDQYRANDDDNRKGLCLKVAEEQARILLYLRSIDAERYALYAHKTFSFCQDHWLQHAKELGIDSAVDKSGRDATIALIVEKSDFKIRFEGDNLWSVRVSSRYLDGPSGAAYLIRDANKPTNESVAGVMLNRYATATISDVELAKRLSLPLLEPTQLTLLGPKSNAAKRSSTQGGASASTGPTVADVIVNLQLPVFERLAVKDLLKIREDERPHFEAFRSALRTAIQDRLASAGDNASASAIARSIDQEYLRPGLAEIERKLRVSRQAVLRKTAVDLTIGAAAAGVAALSSVPLMITGGVAALGSSVPLAPTINSYIEEKKAVKMSDLYFLWQIGKHANH